MKSFRNPKYLERYEDVVFDLEKALSQTTLVNTVSQKRNVQRFVVDNTGEATPFDWYNTRISMDFKLDKLARGAAFTLTNQTGLVNGSNSFIEILNSSANGKEVYSCDYANHCVNIKNLLEYNQSYVNSIATNEFYYPDISANAEERPAQVNYNKGFHQRKLVLGTTGELNCEIPLNRYSFFASLEDKLLPNTRIDLNTEFESDNNLIWRSDGGAEEAGKNYRLTIQKLRLFIPKLIF